MLINKKITFLVHCNNNVNRISTKLHCLSMGLLPNYTVCQWNKCQITLLDNGISVKLPMFVNGMSTKLHCQWDKCQITCTVCQWEIYQIIPSLLNLVKMFFYHMAN